MSELIPLKFYVDGESITDQEIYRRIHAFAALLAVAKAMDATSINDDGYTDGLGRVDEAMDALSATHPTWREWQP